jgi:hypothetical protein
VRDVRASIGVDRTAPAHVRRMYHVKHRVDNSTAKRPDKPLIIGARASKLVELSNPI